MVLVALRLRLRRSRRRWRGLGATAAATALRRALAAAHDTIAISVSAAAALHGVALVLAVGRALMLAGLMLTLLMMGVRIGDRSGRRCLRNGGGSDRKRERGNNDLHLILHRSSTEWYDRSFRRVVEGVGPIRGGGRAGRWIAGQLEQG